MSRAGAVATTLLLPGGSTLARKLVVLDRAALR
jgi:hypothetical protein